MNLKITMLSEGSPTKTSLYCVVPFTYNPGKCKLVSSDRKYLGGWGGGRKGQDYKRAQGTHGVKDLVTLWIVVVVSQVVPHMHTY